MAGKEIDRARARSAVDVVRQHPLMVLFAISPVVIAAIVLGALTQPLWGVLLLIVAALSGGWVVVRKR
jgi:hypothetical protein